MSQQIPLTDGPDAYEITLTASPKAQPKSASGAVTHLTATVANRFTHRPVPDVSVTFSSSVSQAGFSHPIVQTDHQGKAAATITFPHPAQSEYGGGGLVPIRASIRGGSDSLQLVFYSEGLRLVFVTNVKPGNVINKESIAAGVQAVVYPWPGTEPGNIYTLYWGDNKVQRAYSGDNFPWTVDIDKVFDPKQVFSDGVYAVFYEIRDNVGNVAECKPLDITVRF